MNDLEPFFPPVVDATMISTWRSCPEEFFRRHCQGLIPAVAEGRFNIHLHFGACFAKGTEAVRTAWLAGESQPDAILIGAERILREWGNNPYYDPAPSTTHNKTLPSCILALQDYFQRWPLGMDDARIANIDGRPCIEWSGHGYLIGTEHPITYKPIVYAGRFDAIMDVFGKCWGLDDKTATRLGEYWRKRWKLRSQFTGYCWLASLYDIRINTFLIRGVAPLIGETNCDEVIIQRPAHTIARWLDQTIRDVNTMVQQWREQSWPRLLDDRCGSCQFLEMCENIVPDSLLSDYVVARWNPLTTIKEDEP
jgi:hypothetical protein